MRYILIGIGEKLSAQINEVLLGEHCELMDAQRESKKALNSILKLKPQLVILNLDSLSDPFALIEEVNKFLNYRVRFIIISNSKEYSYDAIKCNVSDYIISPIDELELRKSILFIKERLPKKNNEENNLCLKSYNDFHYINLNDILYLKADNNTTDFHIKNGKTVTSYNTLKKFEDTLPSIFKRIHKSYLVNSSYVTRVNFGKNLCKIRNVEEMLPFSKTYLENIRQIKENLQQKSAVELN